MNVNCLNLLASLGRHAPNYRSFRSFRFVCHLLKVSMSSSEKKRTISSTKRDQKTGENRDSWRRSFDSEAEASSHPLIEYPSPLEFVESLVVQPDLTFKILIVGNPHVGKSCFLTRLCSNTFTSRYASTIGVDFYSRAIRLNDEIISLQLWDTAGQERFQSVTRAYYRGAQGVILMYDISREESFIAVKSWINSIQENMDELPTSLLLVGNKVDLEENGKREVSYEAGESFAKRYNADFIESSAKTGYNVGNACLKLVNHLVQESRAQGAAQANRRSFSSPDTKKRPCSC